MNAEAPAASAAMPLHVPAAPAIRKAAALLLLVLALAVGAIYWKQHNEAARVRDVTAKVAQTQGALRRGDLGAAERALAALAAAQPDRPEVKDLRAELDRRMREQVARREQLRDAIAKATKALGLAEPAPSPVQALLPAQAEVGDAGEVGAGRAMEIKCNDALAALALCPAEGAR